MISRTYRPDEVRMSASLDGSDVELEAPDGSRFRGACIGTEHEGVVSWLYRRDDVGSSHYLGCGPGCSSPCVAFGTEGAMLEAVSRLAPELAMSYARETTRRRAAQMGGGLLRRMRDVERVCRCVLTANDAAENMPKPVSVEGAAFVRLRKRLKPLAALAREALRECLDALPVSEIRCDPGDVKPWAVRSCWTVVDDDVCVRTSVRSGKEALDAE